jgi:hypothetical protein
MDSELREAYQRLADDARDYSDVDRVIGAARRRRVRRDVTIGVAVLTLLLGGFGGVQLVTGAGDRPPMSAAPAMPAPSPSTPTFSPPADVPLLPETAVGPATLTYRVCSGGCPTIVALESGAQYRLPDPPGCCGSSATLSPDGKILGYQVTDSYVVRSLTDQRVWRVPRGAGATSIGPSAWAPGSDALLVSSGGPAYMLLDLVDGSQRLVSAPPGTALVALSGNRLPWVAGPENENSEMVVSELQRDGSLRPAATIAPRRHLRSDESVHEPGGGSPMIDNYNLGGDFVIHVLGKSTSAYLRYDATGEFVSRTDKPGNSEQWKYRGPCDGELAFQRDPADGPVALVVVRPGGAVVFATLPPGAWVDLPGAASLLP